MALQVRVNWAHHIESCVETMSQTPQVLCAALQQRVNSVHLATIGEDGLPHTGCVPCLWIDNGLHIFVSRLSVHTQDLLNNPAVSGMLVEDEQDNRQPFARVRLRYQCTAETIGPDHEQYADRLDAFEAKHGKTVQLLRQLPDFVLFNLVPHDAIFVMGFGQAYRLSGPQWSTFEHINTA